MHGNTLPKPESPFPSLWGMLRLILRVGHLEVIDKCGRTRDFGDRQTGPSVTVRLHHRMQPLPRVINPSLAFGEAYMDGTLTVERGSLRDLLHLVTQGLAAHDSHLVKRLRARLSRTFGRSNHLCRARANAAHHYDLSANLYGLFLDDDRQYSCTFIKALR